MSEMWTQGTQLYALGPKSDGSGVMHVIEIEKVTNVSPGTSPRKEIKTTNLKEREAETSIDGLGQSGEANIAINLSTEEPSHHYLLWAYTNRVALKWVIGMSDGWIEEDGEGIKPELEGDEFKLSEERSWQPFNGRITDFSPEFGEDDVVKYSIPVKRSGDPKPQFKKFPVPSGKTVAPKDTGK